MDGQFDRRQKWRLPLLRDDAFEFTSEPDRNYNCVAWAAGDKNAKWWPEPDAPEYYWPPGVRRDGTVDAMKEGFATLGFVPCDDGSFAEGVEKVAIYVTQLGSPQHVALQLPDGAWTSKIGEDDDIRHASPGDLAGGGYGYPAHFMARNRTVAPPDTP